MGILQRLGPWLPLTVATFCFPASAQTLADFFDDSHLHTVHVRMDPGDWILLHERYLENTYYKCEFQWRGIVLPNVGIRSRGSGTRNPIKPNVGFDFSRYTSSQRFLGLKSLVTRNFAQDPSTAHEHLTMKLFARMGLPFERTSHTRLYVNGEYAGVYLLVEPIDSRFLRVHFGEDTGYLYEYTWNGPYRFEYLGEDPGLYVPVPLEPKNHEDAPQAEILVEMIRQMNLATDAEFSATMARHLDLGMLLRHIAVEQFVSENDGFLGFAGLANFYLYRQTSTNRWLFIPWDKDNAFHLPPRSIWENTGENVLIHRALRDPALQRQYADAMHLAAEAAGGAGGWLDQEADRLYWMLRDAVFEDPCMVVLDDVGQTFIRATPEDFEGKFAEIRDFLANRSADVAAQLAAEQLYFDTTPVDVRAGAAENFAYPSLILTPGSLARLQWTSIQPHREEAQAYPIPPSDLVTIAGHPVPILSIDRNEIVFQVPCEAGFGPQPLGIRYYSATSHTIPIDVRPGNPGILAILHENHTPVTEDSPAMPGERLLVELTGLGLPETCIPDGQLSPAPAVTVRGSFAALLNGARISVDTPSFVPGKLGLQQLWLRLPEDLPGGTTVHLTIEANGETGNLVPVAIR